MSRAADEEAASIHECVVSVVAQPALTNTLGPSSAVAAASPPYIIGPTRGGCWVSGRIVALPVTVPVSPSLAAPGSLHRPARPQFIHTLPAVQRRR